MAKKQINKPRQNKRKTASRQQPAALIRMPNRRRTSTVPAAIGFASANVASSMKSVRVSHTEMLGGFEAGVAGVPATYATVQPATLFPWCSGIARNFEKYEVHALKFRYEPTSGTNTGGAAFMLFDTDPYDDIPATIPDMMSSSLSVSCNNWSRMSLTIPPSILKSYHRYFTRIGGVPGDLKTYDVGKLIIANSTVGGVTGNIFVDYDITFHVPQVSVVPSGHIDESAPVVYSNQYGVGDSGTTTGKMPFTMDWPTDNQLGSGATAGLKLLNMAPNAQGLITVTGVGDATTMFPAIASDKVDTVSLTGYMADVAGFHVLRTYKFFNDNTPGWIQPYVQDIAHAVTAMVITIASGKYSSLDG